MYKKLLIIALLCLLLPARAFAAPVSWDFTSNVLQPLRSGWTALILGDHFQASSTAVASTFPYASTTALSVSGLTNGNCVQAGLGGILTSASGACGSGSGGSGTVGTSSSETSGRIPFWTTTGATPALLSGGSAALLWDNTLSKLTATNASTTNLSIGVLSGLLKQSGGVVQAAVAGTDYQAPITLTTSGTSGVATFVANTLNIPNYTSSGGAFPFTPATDYNINTSATTTALWGQNSIFASSSSATLPALAASNSGGGPALVTGAGNVGIGTTTPLGKFSVVGDEQHYGNYYHFGSAVPLYTCTAQSCIELWGNDNTTNGVQINVGNRNSGTSAYNGFSLLNDIATNNVVNYAGMFLNSSTYSDTTFGTSSNIPNQYLIQNTMGRTTILSATSTTEGLINFFTGGTDATNERMRITSTGLTGIGSTTPWGRLSVHQLTGASIVPHFVVASSTATATTTEFIVAPDGKVGIGTTTPNASLSIQAIAGNGTTSPLFAIGSSTANNVSIFNTAATKVGIATSSPTYTLSVEGTLGAHGLTTSASTQSSAICGKEVTGGEFIAESVACLASAERYKKDIQNLPVGLDELMKLRPVTFLWGDEYNKGWENDPNKNGVQYSLIADEVQKVDPNLAIVTTGTTTYGGKEYAPGTVQGLADTNHWVALFVKSIQEVVAEISGVKATVEKQQQEIDSLNARLEKLEK
jgi:hypothetical protein